MLGAGYGDPAITSVNRCPACCTPSVHHLWPPQVATGGVPEDPDCCTSVGHPSGDMLCTPWLATPSGQLELPPTAAIAKYVQYRRDSMSTAIANWPFPQKWPGAAPESCDCIWESRPDPMSTAIGNRADSPESALEAVPRRPIAAKKGPVR